MEKIKSFRDVPWTDVHYDNLWYTSFRAPEPATPGHLIYAPKDTSSASMAAAFKAAYDVGEFMTRTKKWAGFNLGINYGEAAGQTTSWPHIHLLPRYNGDVENPVGGVKNVVKNVI